MRDTPPITNGQSLETAASTDLHADWRPILVGRHRRPRRPPVHQSRLHRRHPDQILPPSHFVNPER